MNKLLRPFLYFSGITAVLTLGFLTILAVSKFDFSVVKIDAKSLPRIFIIESGSMEPAIKTGGVVVVTPSTNYQINDVVTFSYDGNKENMVTHRIEYRGISDTGEMYYLTSGDANNSFDGKAIKDSNIVGKVVYTIPYLGYFADFAKRPQGFILLIVVPATIIIYEELKNLWKHLRDGIKKLIVFARRKKTKQSWFRSPRVLTYARDDSDTFKGSAFQGDDEKSGGVHKAAVVIPVFGAFLLFLNFSSSFFSDTESSVLNSFTAYVPSITPSPVPSPVPGDIVINEVYYFAHNSHDIADSADEWIEIYNNLSFPVSLTGWSISDNTACDDFIGEITLPANGYAIVVDATEAEFRAVWDSVSAPPVGTVFITLANTIGGGLANGGDRAVLRSGTCPANGTVFDQVSWGTDVTAFDPSLVTSGAALSWEREPDGVDTDTAADFVKKNPPTPGD